MTTTIDEMTVPLPEPRKPDEHGAGWFTAGQMLAFGDACRADEREQCCAIVFGHQDSATVAQRTVKAIREQT